MAQGKLAEILKKVNALPDLSAGNVIEQIKTKLQKDKETYEKWEKEGFSVDYPFAELITNKYGATTQNTLLSIVVANNCVNVVNTLIEKKANIDAKSNVGLTPLLIARKNGYMSIVKTLLEKGADRSEIQLSQESRRNAPYKKCGCKRHCCGFCSRSDSCYCTHICYYFIYINND
ncbi:MAG: ankyrin repeat domain-containing protein [Wolbachia sp.]